MKLVLVPLALTELDDATAFYTARGGADLGEAFVDEFERATTLILESPEIGAPFDRAGVAFPCSASRTGVHYQVVADEIRALAVAHQRRTPSYWVARE